MIRRLSLLKRLERLETVHKMQTEPAGRDALIEAGCCDGETHLVMTSSSFGRCWFQERLGRGPQLADFGEFAPVLYLTSDELNA
jgi:hypothetical protein